MDTPKKINLKELFLNLQKQMDADFETYRKNVPHPGTKGDAGEFEWIEWLDKYLPKRYCVDKAFIIDYTGTLSQQIDVVIYDRQYTPFVFNQKGVKYIPAESVYAIFEVKQELDKGNIKYAGEKAKSVRLLERTSAPIIHAGGEIREPKKPFKILAGILTFDCSWSPPLGEPFESALRDLDEDGSLELGCIIRHGAFVNKKVDGMLMLSKGTEDEAWLFFFLNLFMELQRLGTAPAMDVTKYAQVLDSM